MGKYSGVVKMENIKWYACTESLKPWKYLKRELEDKFSFVFLDDLLHKEVVLSYKKNHNDKY